MPFVDSLLDWTWLRKKSARFDRSIETSQTEMHSKKIMNKTEQHIQELWGNFKCCFRCVIGIPRGGKEENGGEKIFEITIHENFPKLMTSTKPHIQETQAGEHQAG